ncbi:MAG TPA: Gfo/Idh/MocA family oxidoreductase [Planctomycetota bacterium]
MTAFDRRDFLVRTAGSAAAFGFAPDLMAVPFGRGRAPLRLAVVGLGRQGRAILGELAKFEQVEIAAICDVDERRLAAGGRRARGAAAFADVGALLAGADGLQAVVIATPTHLHREPAEAALRAGLHVYCEVPLASTTEDARALALAARGSDRVFAVGLTARTNPVYKLARSFVVSGALERTAALEAAWNRKLPWGEAGRGDGGPGDHGWRLNPAVSLGLAGEIGGLQCDVFEWFLRISPAAVRGHGAVRYHDDGRRMADVVQCQFEYEDGLRMSYQASLCSSIGGQYELFRGSNATVKMADTFGWMFKEADAPVQGWEVYASRERFHNDEGITLIADATKLAAQGKLKEGIGLPFPPLYYALEAFLKSALEGAKAHADAAVGLQAAVVGIAAARAVATGERVAIDPADYELD